MSYVLFLDIRCSIIFDFHSSSFQHISFNFKIENLTKNLKLLIMKELIETKLMKKPQKVLKTSPTLYFKTNLYLFMLKIISSFDKQIFSKLKAEYPVRTS